MSAVGPSGLGMFIWQPSKCEGGDLNKLAQKAGRLFDWVALHETYSADLISRLRGQGVFVAVSLYSVPGSAETASFISRACLARAAGAQALLVDAEDAWEHKPPSGSWPDPQNPGRRAEAAKFASQLRAALGDDYWIGDAGSWDWPRYHPLYPDAEFGAVWDAAMPERYWVEFLQNVSYVQAIQESEKEWQTTSKLYKRVVPIGSAYGTNGPVPGGHQPLLLGDLQNFVARYPDCGLWSWMHVPQFAWDWFEQRVAGARSYTQPIATALPDVTPDEPNTDDDPETAG